MPVNKDFRVVKSPISGYGVVASRPFAAGEVVTEAEGILWRDGDGVNDRYSLWMADGVYLDLVDQTRWINHCCDPNLRVSRGVSDSGELWAKFIARRPIAVGEELSFDYAFHAHEAEPCSCGSANCRGMIIDADELASISPQVTAPHR